MATPVHDHSGRAGPRGAPVARRVARRLLASVPGLLGVVCATFLLVRVLPGDPAVAYATGPGTGPAEVAEVRHRLGLDRPLPVQLGLYLRDLAHGNLGRSVVTGQDVATDLAQRLPASLELTGCALALAVLVGVPAGVAAALRPGSAMDLAVRLLCVAGACVPAFVSGLGLVYVFYVRLGWAPDPTVRLDLLAATPPGPTGLYLVDFALAGDWAGWRAAAAHLVLPAATLALWAVAPLARVTRGSMLAVLGSDFVRTAHAVGLGPGRLVLGYALRNALLPVLALAGVMVAGTVGADVVVEAVFAWPGVASYALDALLASDYAPVQGFVLLMAALVGLVTLGVDVLCALADPRVAPE